MATGPRTTPRTDLPPGPRPWPLVGNLSLLWGDRTANLVRTHREHGDLFCLQFSGVPYYVLNDVDALKHVLVDNNKNYVKSKNYEGLRKITGDGLIVTDGELWRRQRRLMQPAFLKKRIDAFAPMITQLAHEHAQEWARQPAGAIVDIHAEMTRLTFRIVGRTLFDIDFASDSDRVGPLAAELIKYSNDLSAAFVPAWVPSRARAAFDAAKRELDRMVFGIVAKRRAQGELGQDLLGLLMGETDESGSMSEQQLRDEIVTLLLAGHDTTANLLTWTFYLLSKNPDADRRLAEELATVLGGREPTADDVPNLVYTDRVLRESMRLYPPVWAFERETVADDDLCGYRIPAGSTVGMSPFSLHRHPKHWENAEDFDPDRFLPERSANRARFAYLPFAAGPRQCIGASMATMEAALVLATLRQRFRVDVVPGQKIELDAVITLRPRGGIRTAVHPI